MQEWPAFLRSPGRCWFADMSHCWSLIGVIDYNPATIWLHKPTIERLSLVLIVFLSPFPWSRHQPYPTWFAEIISMNPVVGWQAVLILRPALSKCLRHPAIPQLVEYPSFYFSLPITVMASEDGKAHVSSMEPFNLPTLRSRHVPDVPQDVDFLMEHLNDPNLDLTTRPPSFASVEKKRKSYQPDVDAESQPDSDRYSTSRAESRMSTAIDFDECVVNWFSCECSNVSHQRVSLSRSTRRCGEYRWPYYACQYFSHVVFGYYLHPFRIGNEPGIRYALCVYISRHLMSVANLDFRPLRLCHWHHYPTNLPSPRSLSCTDPSKEAIQHIWLQMVA